MFEFVDSWYPSARVSIAAGRNGRHKRQRNGVTLTEIIVAAVVLVATMGLIGRATIGAGRTWQTGRLHALAIDELVNQLDRLTSLDGEELDTALVELEVSEDVAKSLDNAVLTSEVIEDHLGRRLRLELTWQRNAVAKPLSLVGWLKPSSDIGKPSKANGESEEVML